MIPKIIHYCWFGGAVKPGKIAKCINSWQTVMPDYTIIEWNESNFDIRINSYAVQAYEVKKYAFVSDVARVEALRKYGGFYMDTDVMAYRRFDDFLESSCVLGFEQHNYIATSFMACEPGHPIMEIFAKQYLNRSFDGQQPETNVTKLAAILKGMGLQSDGSRQTLEYGIEIYPQEYFSPYDYSNCIHHNTDRTYCEHLYYMTWLPPKTRMIKVGKKIIGKLFGAQGVEWLRRQFK